jgi:outer membrane lipoprotein LolB
MSTPMKNVFPSRARLLQILRRLGAVPAAAALVAGCATQHGPTPNQPGTPLPEPMAQSGAVQQAAPAAPQAVTPMVPQGNAQSGQSAANGDASIPAPPPMDLGNASRQTGRFALQYVDTYQRQRNAYGNFVWLQSGDQVSLELRSPLGTTLALIRSAPGSAALEIPGHPIRTAASVDELMQHALGFAMPVDGLRYWLQPAPAPDSPADTVRDPQDASRLKEIRQDGWVINYLAWATAPASGPRLINIERPDPPLTIKLVLDK